LHGRGRTAWQSLPANERKRHRGEENRVLSASNHEGTQALRLFWNPTLHETLLPQ